MKNLFMDFTNLNKTVKTRLFHSFILRLISNSIFPFLSLYLLTKFSVFTVGIITFLGTLFVILGHSTISKINYLSDKQKLMITFKGLIVTLLILGIISYIDRITSLFFISILFVSVLMVYYFLSGVLSPLIDSLLYPFLVGEQKKKVSAISYWLNNISSVIGIMMGIFTSRNNLSILFIVMSLFCCVSATLFSKTLMEEESSNQGRKEKERKKQAYKSDINKMLIIFFSLGTCLIFMIESRFNDLLSVYLTNHQSVESVTRKLIGNALLINYVTVVLFSPLFERILKSITSKKRLILGMIIMTISLAAMFIGELNIIKIYILVFPYTVGEILYFPSRQIELASLISKESVTAAYAIDRTFTTGAKLLSSFLILLVGIPNILLGVLFVCLFLSILMLFLQVYSDKKNEISTKLINKVRIDNSYEKRDAN